MKLEQAARQALEALEDIFGKGKVDVGAITALREALVHSGEADEMVEFFSKEMKNKISVARAEQAEQEPVAVGKVNDQACIDWFEGITDYEAPVGATLYAAPVRTKDLTDAFINELHKDAQDPISFARAVIAADREKNKCQH